MDPLPTSSMAGDRSRSREVAVLGGGVSGKAARRLLESEGWEVQVFDEHGGERGNPVFQPAPGQFSFAVVSPGFPVNHAWRSAAGEVGLQLVGESAYASSLWKGSVICVTGTNGKTTLTRLIEEALHRNGENAFACGNIGRPFSDLCLGQTDREGWAVCEASSFQLYDWARVACDAGFWTNFDIDHLDWHPDLADYFSAKWKMVEAGNPVLAGPSVLRWAGEFGREIPGNLIAVEEGVTVDAAEIGVFGGKPWSELFSLIHRWWSMTGRDEKVLLDAAGDFELSPHRMETVRVRNGVSFINDSKATNPHAALAAVGGVRGPVHWIGGGSWKGEDLASFAGLLAERISSADTFGSTGEELAEILRYEGCQARFHPELREAFVAAVSHAQPGSTVLLSPGFASFDQFSGYADRGEAFCNLVKCLNQPAR